MDEEKYLELIEVVKDIRLLLSDVLHVNEACFDYVIKKDDQFLKAKISEIEKSLLIAKNLDITSDNT